MHVADRLNIPAGGLTPEIIHERLELRGASPALLERMGGFFRACDLARFTSAQATGTEMENAYREATAILEELRKTRL